MTDLKKLVTVVVISARDLRVIPPGLRLALDSGSCDHFSTRVIA